MPPPFDVDSFIVVTTTTTNNNDNDDVRKACDWAIRRAPFIIVAGDVQTRELKTGLREVRISRKFLILNWVWYSRGWTLIANFWLSFDTVDNYTRKLMNCSGRIIFSMRSMTSLFDKISKWLVPPYVANLCRILPCISRRTMEISYLLLFSLPDFPSTISCMGITGSFPCHDIDVTVGSRDFSYAKYANWSIGVVIYL